MEHVMFNHQNRHRGGAGHHTTSLGRKHATFLAIMCGIMLIAVYGVMSVVNLSAHANTTQPWQKLSTQFAEATPSLTELTSPLTIKYKTVDTPMLSWQYSYNDIYELVADSKGNDAGSLGVYEADVDSATFTLIDEIALPENGVTFDAKKYLTSQDDLIVVTLRQSAFEFASMIYQDDLALQECTISFCVFALTENGNAGVVIEDSSMFPALYCGGAPDNNPSFTFIDGPVFGMQMMKTVNNTAFIPESMEPRSLIPMGRSLTDISDMSADELINSTIDAIGSVNVDTYANSSDQTYMFSNLVSGAVFEITYSDGTKVRTTPTSSYGLTSISLDHYIDMNTPEAPIKFPIEFTIQEITAPSGCVLDDTVYSVSISKEQVVTVSPDNDVVNFSTGINNGMFFFNDTGKEKAVTVEKVAELNDANDNGIADEGEAIDYTFFITNDGSDLIGDMRLEDPMLGFTGDDAITVKKDLPDDIFKPRPESVEPYDAVHYRPNMIGPDSVSQMQEALNEYMLFPGETVRIKSPVSYTVTDDDVEAGIVTNEATFVGQTVLRFTGDENVMEVLNERHAVVILHPHRPTPYPESIIRTTPLAMYEYPAETTRAVVNMLSRNVLVRYPDVKVVVPHCGSFLPLAIPRMKAILPAMVGNGYMQPVDWEGNLSRLYYDLAGNPTAEVVHALLSITSPEHILYGSDYPYLPENVLRDNLEKLKKVLASDEELCRYMDMFLWKNASLLFNNQIEE